MALVTDYHDDTCSILRFDWLDDEALDSADDEGDDTCLLRLGEAPMRLPGKSL